jgi:hypothetical protein
VDEEGGRTVVHVYELDVTTDTYKDTGLYRGELTLRVPFPIELDLDKLTAEG